MEKTKKEILHERNERIRAMRKIGASPQALTIRFGLTRQTIQNILEPKTTVK